MTRFLVAAVAVALFAADSQAGILFRSRARSSCPSGQCSPSVSFPAAATPAPPAASKSDSPVKLTPANCPDGRCPAPPMERRGLGLGLFRR